MADTAIIDVNGTTNPVLIDCFLVKNGTLADLNSASQTFKSRATTLKRRMWWQNFKLVGFVVLFVSR